MRDGGGAHPELGEPTVSYAPIERAPTSDLAATVGRVERCVGLCLLLASRRDGEWWRATALRLHGLAREMDAELAGRMGR